MKARPECILNVVSNVIKLAKSVSHDDWLQRRVLVEAMKTIGEDGIDRPAAEIMYSTIRQAGKTLGAQDGFEEERTLFTKQALAIEDKAREWIANSDDRLLASAKLAAAAGIFGINGAENADPDQFLKNKIIEDFASDDFEEFTEDLANAKNLLYILGNAGEAVFDRLFIEELGQKNITCVVRQVPILLAATLEDAKAAGLDKVAALIDPGVDVLGTPPALVSSEFKETLKSTDLIIAKGQDNYETIARAELPPTYFLLTAACVCSGREIGINVGDTAFIKNTGEQ